jgi:hypothetical protein
MSDKEELKENLLCTLFTQNWDQVKHLKSIITWFTEVYMAFVVGAVLVLERAGEHLKNQTLLLIFFLLLALLGLVITHRMDTRIKLRSKIGKKIMLEHNMGEYTLEAVQQEEIEQRKKEKISMASLRVKGIGITWRQCLILFYFIMCIIWLFLLFD